MYNVNVFFKDAACYAATNKSLATTINTDINPKAAQLHHYLHPLQKVDSEKAHIIMKVDFEKTDNIMRK